MKIIIAEMIADIGLNNETIYVELGYKFKDDKSTFEFIDQYSELYSWEEAWFLNDNPIIL